MPSPTRPASRAPALLLLLAIVAAALAGCAAQSVKANVQAEKVLEEAGVKVDHVYVNVEPVSGGPDTDAGARIIQVEVTLETAGAPDQATVDTVAKTLWARSIAHIDAVLVQDSAKDEASAVKLTGEQLTQRFGQRPAGVEQISADTLAAEDREQTKGLFTFVALLPLLTVAAIVGFLLLVAVIVIVIVVSRRKRLRPVRSA